MCLCSIRSRVSADIHRSATARRSVVLVNRHEAPPQVSALTFLPSARGKQLGQLVQPPFKRRALRRYAPVRHGTRAGPRRLEGVSQCVCGFLRHISVVSFPQRLVKVGPEGVAAGAENGQTQDPMLTLTLNDPPLLCPLRSRQVHPPQPRRRPVRCSPPSS